MSLAMRPAAPPSDAPAGVTEGARDTPAPRYRVERFSAPGEFFSRLAAGHAEATPFQDARWLEPLLDEVAPAHGASFVGLVTTEHDTGALAMALPLVVRRVKGLSIAGFANFGVSDYGGPILGPAAPSDRASATHVWRQIAGKLSEVDALHLESMPRTIAGRINPLAGLPGTLAARHSGHSVTVSGTVEEFLRARGKKYRKEVERCYRQLEKEGTWTFTRAETRDELAAIYEALEQQQRARRQRAGDTYSLDRPEYSRFYERLLREGRESGFAHLFALRSGTEIVATLLGLTTGGTFTLLRISNAGERWRHVSPGRLVVIEAMRTLTEKGIRRFDMGIGDYAFKDGFGAGTEPLTDLVRGLTLKGHAYAALVHAKARARRNPRLRTMIGFIANWR